MYSTIDVDVWTDVHLEHYYVTNIVRVLNRAYAELNSICLKLGEPSFVPREKIEKNRQFYIQAESTLKSTCRNFKVKVELIPIEQPQFLKLLAFRDENVSSKEMTIEQMDKERTRWVREQMDMVWYPNVFSSHSEALDRSLDYLYIVERDTKFVEKVYDHLQNIIKAA